MKTARPVRVPAVPDNPHLRGLIALFGDIAVPAAAMAPFRTIVLLCYTNRSGSSFLAEALQSTGRLNAAVEMLNHADAAAERQRSRHPSFAAFLAAEMYWRAVGGRIAVKVALPHLEVLGRAGVLDTCRDRLRYVFVTRRDVLGQAISADLAWQTGQWTSRVTVEVAPDRLSFSRARLAQRMREIEAENAAWEAFFRDNRSAPLRVVYEDLTADPAGTVHALGAALGLGEVAYDPARITLQRQAGPLNAHWRALFLRG